VGNALFADEPARSTHVNTWDRAGAEFVTTEAELRAMGPLAPAIESKAVPGIDDLSRCSPGRRACSSSSPPAQVEELFVRCGNALRRSGAWDPESWRDPVSLPTAGQLFKSQLETAAAYGW
jgi:hypothetical protein